MKHALRLAFFLLISTLALSACNKGTSTASSSAPPASATPGAAAAPASPSPSLSPPSPAAASQTYKEKEGLFEISFPQGYVYQETESGVLFFSKDQGFGGSVDFGSALGNQLSSQDLEMALKQEYEKRLKEVKWQESDVQQDGSVRVDWTGKDPDGNALDAVSFVEQRGDTIFILNLFGINKAYQDYNSDAEKIVNSYRVQRQ